VSQQWSTVRTGSLRKDSRRHRASTSTVRKGVKAEWAGGVVHDITDGAEYDKMMSETSGKLVILMASTTFCGPCKMIKPIYTRYAAEYGDAVFAYLEGDKTDDSKRLMTRLGLRSVPTFFFLKGDETLEEFAGADDTVLKATIDKYI